MKRVSPECTVVHPFSGGKRRAEAVKRSEWRSWVPWLVAAAVTGCNQPPVIEQVGEYQVADSVLDYLHGDVQESVSFEAYAGELLEFRVVAVDPEGGPVRYAAGPLPDGADFDEKHGLFQWTPPADAGNDGGWYELYVVAMDEADAWDSIVVGLSIYAPLPPAEPEPPRAMLDVERDLLPVWWR